jgi:hypothetical protein
LVGGSNGFNTLTIAAENATIVPSPLNPTSVKATAKGEAPAFSLRGTCSRPPMAAPATSVI